MIESIEISFLLKVFIVSSPQETVDNIKSRYELLDIIRGSAVVLMIIFHFSFDLRIFGYTEVDFQENLFWWVFPRVIVFLFLTAMGLSLEVTYKGKLEPKKVLRRFFKIGGFALLISLFTYFAFPTRWIYFGTLHCIALCSLLALPFQGKKWISLSGAFVILIPLLAGFQWPWFKMEHASMDYIPALPWLGVVLLGMFSFHLNVHKTPIVSFPGKSWLLFCGRHSLIIYLIHQPILFGLVKIFYTISPP
jgi:uncharacterized membrane protein